MQVNLKYEDGDPVVQFGVRRKVIDKLQDIYASDLTNVSFAYDGDKNLYTIGALQHVRNEYTVVVEDASSAKWTIHISYIWLLMILRCCS